MERPDGIEDMETAIALEKRKVKEIHSYACSAEDGGVCDSSPVTPIKQNAPKKKRSEPSLSDVQDNIISILTAKINERADHIEDMVKRNAVSMSIFKKPLTSR